MSSSTKNVKLGICKIFFDGQDLGYTQGGVEVQVSTETTKVEVDQFGKTAINELIQGRSVSVTVPLAETTLRNLIATMPGATLTTDGVQASGTLTFSAQPVNNSIVTIGGTAFTFVTATPTGPTQVKIGATLAATLINLKMAIDSYQFASGSAVNSAGGVFAAINAANTVLTVTAVDPGTLGNAVTLVAGSAPATNATASGANLTGGTNETRARVDVTSGAGLDMLSIAKVLRLHPKEKADNDFTEDFIMWRAASSGALQFAYQVENVRIYNATFMAYPDPNSPNSRMFSIGDPFYQP